jgi:hypothetical protein
VDYYLSDERHRFDSPDGHRMAWVEVPEGSTPVFVVVDLDRNPRTAQLLADYADHVLVPQDPTQASVWMAPIEAWVANTQAAAK